MIANLDENNPILDTILEKTISKDSPSDLKDHTDIKKSHLIEIFKTLFWTSLKREENRSITGTIVLRNRTSNFGAMKFKTPLPFTTQNLVQLMMAAGSNRLLVDLNSDGKLEIYGYITPKIFTSTTRNMASDYINIHNLLFSIADVGKIVCFKKQPIGLLAFYSDGYLKSPTIQSNTMAKQFISEVFQEKFPDNVEKTEYLFQSLKAIHNHKHGGTVIILSKNEIENSSIKATANLKPRYEFSTPSKLITDWHSEAKKAHETMEKNNNENEATYPENIDHEVINSHQTYALHGLDSLGSLAKIDGAVVIDENFNVYGFGAKIDLPLEKDIKYLVSDILDIDVSKEKRLDELGGMRHQSAANYVQKYHESLAFVVSQDGNISLMAWDKSEAKVTVIRNLQYYLYE